VSVLLLIAFAAVTAGAGYALFAGELLLCIALLSLSGVLGLTFAQRVPSLAREDGEFERNVAALSLCVVFAGALAATSSV